MKLSLVTEPNPILFVKSKSLSLEEIHSKKIQSLAKAMIPAMYAFKGVGLAAPQVGYNIALCVIAKEATPDKKNDLILFNPAWTKYTKKKVNDLEGCLSVPHLFGTVARYKEISVTAIDHTGKSMNFSASGFFARVIQHEVDHLEGHLFIEKAVNIHEEREKTI